jgi:peptide/nickel transport system substrate-binding protein
MMRSARLLGLVGLVAVLALVGVGRSSGSGKTSAKRGGELTFARGFDVITWNPLKTNGDNGTLWDIEQIYDQLVEYRPGSLKLQPGLAKSWTVSKDARTYTFHLRNARFSNGAPVTAEDVKFSIERYANPKIDPGLSFLVASVKKILTPDPRTVVIRLKQPDGLFPAGLAIPTASITPKAVVLKEGENGFGKHPVGSGPFMLKKWIRGKLVQLVRNPYYWRKGYPLLDAVNITFVQNDTTRMLQVQSGQADVAEAVPFSQIQQLDAQPGIHVQVEPIWAYDAIWLNHKYAPLADRNVRQALNYALDKDAINRAVYDGKAIVANSTVAQTQWWDKSVPAYPFDLAKAQALMAKSKFPKGFKLSLSVPAGDTVHGEVAVIAKDAWAKLGVQVTITTEDTATLFDQYSKGNYQASIPLPKITSDIAVPDELAVAWLEYSPGYQSFFTYYNNPVIGALVNKANHAVGDTKRAALWRRVQRLSMQDAPWVPLFFVPAVTAVRDNVQNFRTLQSGWWDLFAVSKK